MARPDRAIFLFSRVFQVYYRQDRCLNGLIFIGQVSMKDIFYCAFMIALVCSFLNCGHALGKGKTKHENTTQQKHSKIRKKYPLIPPPPSLSSKPERSTEKLSRSEDEMDFVCVLPSQTWVESALTHFKTRINSKWRRRNNFKKDLLCSVVFKVSKDGKPIGIKVTHYSTDEEYDTHCTKAIQQASPYNKKYSGLYFKLDFDNSKSKL